MIEEIDLALTEHLSPMIKIKKPFLQFATRQCKISWVVFLLKDNYYKRHQLSRFSLNIFDFMEKN